jgi:DNA polymerase III delta subunit
MQLLVIADGLDDLPTDSELTTLAAALSQVTRASMLMIFDPAPRRALPYPLFTMRPLEPSDTARLVHSLSGRMALEVDQEAEQQLAEASGGHPLILRELAGLATLARCKLDRRVTGEDVQSAEVVYLQRSESALVDLARSLAPEQRAAIQQAMTGHPSRNGEVERLQALGWLCTRNGRLDCFSAVLSRSLETT